MSVQKHFYSDENAVALIIVCCSGLSVVGACYIIYRYIKNKTNCCRHHIQLNETNILRFASNLILWLAITDLIDYSSEFIGASLFLFGSWNDNICLFQAIGTHFGSVSSVAWTVAMSWTIHQIIKSPQSEVWRMAKQIHVVIWCASIICIIPPVITNSYGEAQGHCWIKNEGCGKYERWICFYIPLWMSIAYMIYVYIMLIQLNHTADTASNTTVLLRNMRYFPAILMLCYVPATIKRVWDGVTTNKTPSIEFGLQCVMYGCLMIMGFCDGILYGCLFSTTSNNSSQPSNDPSPPQVESLLQLSELTNANNAHISTSDDNSGNRPSNSGNRSSKSGNRPRHIHKTVEQQEEVIFNKDLNICSNSDCNGNVVQATKYSKQMPVIQKNIGKMIDPHEENNEYMEVIIESN